MTALNVSLSRCTFRAASALLGTLLMGSLPALAQTTTATGALIPSFKDYPVATVMASLLFVIVVTMMLYRGRHFMFILNRLAGVQRHPSIDIAFACWPLITVYIAAHNEEKVIAGWIEALLNTEHPAERLVSGIGAVWSLMLDRIFKQAMVWGKTIRYRAKAAE